MKIGTLHLTDAGTRAVEHESVTHTAYLCTTHVSRVFLAESLETGEVAVILTSPVDSPSQRS